MLAGILFLSAIIVVGVLITVDVVRTPNEVPAGSADRPPRDAERPLATARAGAGAHAFARQPAVRDQPVAAPGPRAAAAPVEVDSFGRPDQAARGFDPTRREVPPAPSDLQRGGFNAMFANMARRTQALVERQLRLIESLEHGEQDQQRLASLSRLNRIAMHMHRNSQNLLVLAGHEPTGVWNQPVTLAHLVEAAVSEVEDYERVSFEVQPDIAVRGPAVHDAVHLLVELIDNATSFSAADMPVQIKGEVLTSGGALIDITDRGIGMAAKEMAYANQRLDHPPPPDIDVPKWMGLLVVARLAARHGIRVRLNQSEIGGLTALVWLPDELLTHYGATAGPGVATGQRAAADSLPGMTPVRMSTPDVATTRRDPAWSARGSHAMLPADAPAAVRLPGRGAPNPGVDVAVPRAESQTANRGLPVFDEVGPRRTPSGHDGSGPAGFNAAAASAEGGLPRRSQATTPGPRGNPGPSAGPASRAGVHRSPSQAWASPADEANPGVPDKS